MHTVVYAVISIIAAATVITAVCVIAIRSKNKHKAKSGFNEVKIGMTENELYALLGTPKKTIDVDGATRVVTYTEMKYAFLWLIATELEAQISIKNGTVTNISIT